MQSSNIESNLACLRSLLERVHHVAAVFQQFLLAGVDVLVGGTCRVDRRLAIFQPVSNFTCLKLSDVGQLLLQKKREKYKLKFLP